jgi:hypothetical protein
VASAHAFGADQCSLSTTVQHAMEACDLKRADQKALETAGRGCVLVLGIVGPDSVLFAKLRCVCADAPSAPGVAATQASSPSIVPEAPVFTGVDLTAEDVAPPGIGDALVPAAIAHAGDTCVSLPGALAEQTEQVRFRLRQLRSMCFVLP